MNDEERIGFRWRLVRAAFVTAQMLSKLYDAPA